MSAPGKTSLLVPDVRVGDVWEDCDTRDRHEPRRIRVLSFVSGRARCQDVATGRGTTIAVARFAPTAMGYRLVERGGR